MTGVDLASFANGWYHPGRPAWLRAAWFAVGLPLLRCGWIPSSSFRVRLLRLFGAALGPGMVIKPGVRIKHPWLLAAGRNCWLGEDAWIDNLASVTLGDNVCISQGSYLCTGNHDWSDPAFGLIVRPITLRDGAWAGARSVLCPGVELGEGAIAAAGSVVVRNIPAWEIHAGNPAALIRRRALRRPQDLVEVAS
jgi:putative colanic acid biosynthesis acetyltransferase WcaF